jgi:hypothetical protein
MSHEFMLARARPGVCSKLLYSNDYHTVKASGDTVRHPTWLNMAGADVKDAQAQMRHSRASTTLDIYQQFVPERQQLV